MDRQAQNPDDMVEIIASFSDSEPKREGKDFRTACPLCGNDHGLVISPGKGLFKCFDCGALKGKTPYQYLTAGQKMDSIEAVKWLADWYHIVVEYEQYERPVPKARKTSAGRPESFCSRMLTGSGLTFQDVTATVLDIEQNRSHFKESTFMPGTVNGRGEIVKDGDDAVIKYFDLDGKPMMYVSEKDKTATPRRYYRVRYQYPSEHTDKSGKEMKYKSPSGAPTFIYIPQKIRALYKAKADIGALYIQEGEKKAEKACKHGIDSIAVSGIQNLGYKGTLPEEVVKIIETCHVKEVIFLLDSDCFDLTNHIRVDDPVERRPKNFYYAVKNYKEYLNRLKNRELYVEVYFGYVLKNEAGDKGIDDLLTNTLKGHEDDLLKDIITAKNEKDMTGKYVRLHKITTATDAKIMEVWSLQSNREFCKKYYELLKDLPEFTFGNRRYRFNDNGELESAQPVEADEQFWKEVKHKDRPTDYMFCYTGCKQFLEHRGFYRYRRADGEFDFIHLQGPVVETVKYWAVGDYVKDFAHDCLKKDVLEMLLKGGSQYFGPVVLQMLSFYEPSFFKGVRGVQRFYFADSWWHITAEKIRVESYNQLHENIWDEQKKIGFAPKLLPSLINIERKADGSFSYRITATGENCHFLQYLVNASDFTWCKKKEDITDQEISENAQHLVSKLAAFGYLVSQEKSKQVTKAVIGMDGLQSEVGDSNGRSGKSLLGEAVKQVVSSKYYNGKEISSRGGSQFQWDGVNEKTKVVFIDDAMKDFDFELLFGLITGDWPVNPKGAQPYVLPFEKSPKIYLTTNHAISGNGSSFIDRQWILAFSDFYNDTHKPVDDFGMLFFDEWDGNQWELFWNLVAQCVQIYFRFGCVQAGGNKAEQRRLRQEVGEEFLMWADEYFSDERRLDVEILRSDIYEALKSYVGNGRSQFYTPTGFSKRLRAYCKFRGYLLNPDCYNPSTKEYRRYDNTTGRPVTTIKRGGVEYFMIARPDYYDTHALPDMFNDIPEDLPE